MFTRVVRTKRDEDVYGREGRGGGLRYRPAKTDDRGQG